MDISKALTMRKWVLIAGCMMLIEAAGPWPVRAETPQAADVTYQNDVLTTTGNQATWGESVNPANREALQRSRIITNRNDFMTSAAMGPFEVRNLKTDHFQD